ncbi:hypothetical protein [Jeotgalibacillus proteolyticus]|uniref:DUF4829 domain-containing protein n=1 Tax=Jeotgalibacillus proteolyticus TaxID=2082395 RepID=A0A2S5GBI7_9BACL|nr:hypothetical protein [Jeotgalibacillus proteolyticus]PPA70370.1 hypothetical protein C4B60_12390 [Jeotgalibacillus proteolyticus]
MRRRRRIKRLFFVLIVIASLLSLAGYITYSFSADYQTKKVVEEFYTLEQEAQFAESWELLHPLMHERWEKGSYIQDRAHVFLNHFGVETFTFIIEEDIELSEWKMNKETPALKNVHKYIVIQSYQGKYGKFRFIQDVYLAKEDGEWMILWDYN